MQQQNEHLQKMIEVKENKTRKDNSYMFKKLASHNLSMYNGAPDPRAFKDWIQGIEKLFDALQCSKDCMEGFAIFYLKDEADLWWATIREM